MNLQAALVGNACMDFRNGLFESKCDCIFSVKIRACMWDRITKGQAIYTFLEFRPWWFASSKPSRKRVCSLPDTEQNLTGDLGKLPSVHSTKPALVVSPNGQISDIDEAPCISNLEKNQISHYLTFVLFCEISKAPVWLTSICTQLNL